MVSQPARPCAITPSATHLEGTAKVGVMSNLTGQGGINICKHSLLATLDPPGAVLVQAVEGKQHHGGGHCR